MVKCSEKAFLISLSTRYYLLFDSLHIEESRHSSIGTKLYNFLCRIDDSAKMKTIDTILEQLGNFKMQWLDEKTERKKWEQIFKESEYYDEKKINELKENRNIFDHPNIKWMDLNSRLDELKEIHELYSFEIICNRNSITISNLFSLMVAAINPGELVLPVYLNPSKSEDIYKSKSTPDGGPNDYLDAIISHLIIEYAKIYFSP